MSTPQATPISAISGMVNDAIVHRVEATVKKVFKHRTGTNQRGEWSLQDIVLTQDSAEIVAVFSDRDEIPATWQGRRIILEAYHGERGWSGIKTLDDTYTKKGTTVPVTTRKLKVTPTGDVSLLDDGAGQQQARPQQAQQQAAQAPAGKPAQTQRPQEQNHDTGEETPEEKRVRIELQEKIALRDLKAMAYRVANLQLLALNTVEQYVAPRFEAVSKRELGPDEKHAFAMNMTIELARQGGVMLSSPKRREDSEKPKTTPQSQHPSSEQPAHQGGDMLPEGQAYRF